MGPGYSQQRDLFEPDRRIQEIPSASRREIIRLIEDLLAEALGAGGTELQSEDQATKEAPHEQDHA